MTLLDALYKVSKKDMTDEEKFRSACLKVYRKHVRTYEDLLITNLAFLHGMFMTFYSYYVGLDVTHAAAGVANTLVQLHEHGVFTVDGQGNSCDDKYRERSYIEAVFPKVLYPQLLEQVEKRREDVFFVFSFTTGGILNTNLTPAHLTDVYGNKNRVQHEVGLALTQGKYDGDTAWRTDTMVFASRLSYPSQAMPHPEDKLNHVDQLLRHECYSIKLIARNFCSLLADQVLLDCVMAAGFFRFVTDPFQPVGGGYSHARGYLKMK